MPSSPILFDPISKSSRWWSCPMVSSDSSEICVPTSDRIAEPRQAGEMPNSLVGHLGPVQVELFEILELADLRHDVVGDVGAFERQGDDIAVAEHDAGAESLQRGQHLALGPASGLAFRRPRAPRNRRALPAAVFASEPRQRANATWSRYAANERSPVPSEKKSASMITKMIRAASEINIPPRSTMDFRGFCLIWCVTLSRSHAETIRIPAVRHLT